MLIATYFHLEMWGLSINFTYDIFPYETRKSFCRQFQHSFPLDVEPGAFIIMMMMMMIY